VENSIAHPAQRSAEAGTCVTKQAPKKDKRNAAPAAAKRRSASALCARKIAVALAPHFDQLVGAQTSIAANPKTAPELDYTASPTIASVAPKK
jgi:hypothetical protein